MKEGSQETVDQAQIVDALNRRIAQAMSLEG